MAVHEVCYYTTGSLGQIIGVLLDNLVEVDALQQDNLLSVGREHKTLHFALGFRQLLAFVTFKVHFPDLATFQEGNGLVVQPLCIRLVAGFGGELFLFCTISVHHPEHLMALVLFHAVVTQLEDNVLAVW